MNFTEEERRMMLCTGDNISYFNANRRKGKLDVVYYVDNGNKADVLRDGKRIVSCVTIDQSMYAVAGIINYEKER